MYVYTGTQRTAHSRDWQCCDYRSIEQGIYRHETTPRYRNAAIAVRPITAKRTDRHTGAQTDRQTGWSQYSAPPPGRSN